MNIHFDRTYAGIGSRKLSKQNSKKLITFAFVRALNGWAVTSGAADGSDMAFEVGARLGYRLLNKLNPELYPKNKYSLVQNIYISLGIISTEEKIANTKVIPAKYRMLNSK